MSDVRWPCLDNKMLFTEFKKAMKDKKLQDYQLKELEQKLNDETSKVRKLESSNEILSKKVRPIYTGLEEIFMERFVLTDAHLLPGADSKNEILGYCENCYTSFGFKLETNIQAHCKTTGERDLCRELPPDLMCPLCTQYWMADKVSYSP